jgi:hypothetical protein
MTDAQLLELWKARYEKLLVLEVQAHQHYRTLLKKYAHVLDGEL